MRQRGRRRLSRPAVAWVVALTALALAPTLAAGYVLTYDMVFAPRQDLLPAALGLGGGLPRAVPQDAVVALLTALVPGWLVQKAALVGALLAAGLGAARLLPRRPWWVPALGATLYVWSAYVAERLVLGHWGLLVAYAVLPWALAAALAVRRGRPAAARLVLLCALAALTPSGGVLVAVVAGPVAVGPRARIRTRSRWLVAGGAVAVNLPWLLPSVLHPAAGLSDPDGAGVFALRAEGPWGALLTALGTGGVWNADVVPLSRTWWTAPALALAVTAAAVAGGRPLVRRLGRAAGTWLAVTAGGGLVLALASAWLPDLARWWVTSVPGLGLARDAQKWLAPLSLLLALAAPLGVRRVVDRIRDPGARAALAVLLLVVPLAVLPDLVWGVGGRLVPVAYPAGWNEVRAELAESERPGDLAVLPWAAFRAFEWNGNRTVLDPAPRWSPRTSVVEDTLVVAGPGGDLVRVSGEDPRAAAIGAALDAGRPLAEVLPDLGVGFVLVEVGQPPGVPVGVLAGLPEVLRADGLVLLEVPDAREGPGLPEYAPVVVAVDAAVVLLLAVLLVGVAVGGRRRLSESDPPVGGDGRTAAPGAATLTGSPAGE